MGKNIKRRITALLLTALVSIVATGCAKSISEDTENSETVSATTTEESTSTETVAVNKSSSTESETTTESKTVNATTAATTEQTTEAITTTEVSTRSASASTTETTVVQSTIESTTASTQATTHAATEVPTTDHAHNWVIVTKTVEVPAETHTEVHYFRIDNGQDVTGSDICGKDGKTVVQTGSYTAAECNCGFTGKYEEVMAHQTEMEAGGEALKHGKTMTHTEFTYTEVESRTITVVDQEATTIQIPAGYQCTICGEYRESTDVSTNDTTPWWKKIWGNISIIK